MTLHRLGPLATIAAILGLASTALAQDPLPCGTPEEPQLQFHWVPSEGEVSHYLLHIGRTSGAYDTVVPMTAIEVDPSDDTLWGFDGVFPTDVTWYVVLTAEGPGGSSPLSNELVIPATVRECFPPSAPRLLDALRTAMNALRDAIAELEND